MIRHSEKSSSLIENSQKSTNAGANSTMSNASGSSAAAANGISDVNSNNPLSDSGNTAATSASASGSAIQSNTTSAYTLYLEHLGGFLPILKGKRVSKIRPEFIIYDPQLPSTLRI